MRNRKHVVRTGNADRLLDSCSGPAPDQQDVDLGALANGEVPQRSAAQVLGQLDLANHVAVAQVDGLALADCADAAVGSCDQCGAPGSCASGPCPADIDLDGEVGFSDLLEVLSNWGPCR